MDVLLAAGSVVLWVRRKGWRWETRTGLGCRGEGEERGGGSSGCELATARRDEGESRGG